MFRHKVNSNMLYIFEGHDPTSDRGNFTVVIEAYNLHFAAKKFKEHIDSLGKNLIPTVTTCTPETGIKYSNVEKVH